MGVWLGNLEYKILYHITLERETVYDLTYDVRERKRRYPHYAILRLVRNHLDTKGYFKIKRSRWGFTRWVPDCEKIAELSEHIDGTKSMISDFKVRRPNIYAQLMNEIEDAIRVRTEVPDID
jgi:hypothetical protein